MEAFFTFLQDSVSGESFDPRAARPRCKVCGADAWLQWDGRYADFCSRSCRDQWAASQGHVPTQGSQDLSRREGGGGKEPSGMLGHRQVQLQQEKDEQWEQTFPPRNRNLPRRRAQLQMQNPWMQQQQNKIDPGGAAAAVGAFAEAAAAKKVARVLREKVPKKNSPVQPKAQRLESRILSAANTPRKMASTADRGTDEELPLQRQRTVARFVEEGENAAELQSALRDYQESLQRQRQKSGEKAVDSAASASPVATVGAADKDTHVHSKQPEMGLLQQEREKHEEQMKAFAEETKQQLGQQWAQLEAELQRIAAEESGAQKTLEAQLKQVRADLQQLKQQHEQQQLQQQNVAESRLEQQLKAHLKEELEQQMERKLEERLQKQLKEQAEEQWKKKMSLTGSESVSMRPSEEHQLLQHLLDQKEQLQQRLLQQQRQQEELMYRLQQQQEQALQALRKLAPPAESYYGQEKKSSSTSNHHLESLLLEALLSRLKTKDNHQLKEKNQEWQRTSELSSWEQRELALRDAAVAAAAVAKEVDVDQHFEGQLETTVLRASLLLPDPAPVQPQRQGLQFGSKLQVVLRCATGPGEWEEKESSLSADGQWQETFTFSIHWPSAATAAAASAALYAQLWATKYSSNSNTATTAAHRDNSKCCFVGEAVLPLPSFTSAWEYRAPLRWRSSLGGRRQQQPLLQQGDLLLRVQFHPANVKPLEVLHQLKDLQSPYLTERAKHGPQSQTSSATDNRGSSGSSRRTDSNSSSTSIKDCCESEKQLLPLSPLKEVTEGADTLQQRLLQQLDALSTAWRRAVAEQQQQQYPLPVSIDSQSLQEHLRQSALMGALCTNSLCSNLAGPFADLYSEEEFRVWGLCNACQKQLFTTPLSQGGLKSQAKPRLQLASPFASCCRDNCHDIGNIQALARATASHGSPQFGELRLDGNIPVAFPTSDCIWPSALQLLHAQRFSQLSVQERLRRCCCSSELLALLQCPLLQAFERLDWHSRAAAAVRTCLLLLLRQHPKLQLLLSTLQGFHISYHDPLQQRLLRRMQHQQRHCEGKKVGDLGRKELRGKTKVPFLPRNFAGLLLMDLCAALGPPNRD
ncbi:hypothetical protein, conserved [Eimeria tenella]|uniref:Uncharacterized protein n=1 Tax=Eimeria tenella TaxID=5802 RepID=U6KY78_EIMTE|nr:hypothetical protein, conserved [Eimeria tenella]CDJ43122.1 hypothetical protein, conserved [Eimeria tenella]|eukprot:XP_013233872.1 hypothetical protein, conserved [Eimeria tenella]